MAARVHMGLVREGEPGPSLAELLADPGRAALEPAAAVPALLAQLAADGAARAAVQTALAARLALVVTEAPNGLARDELLDVDAAAALVGRSPSWLRKHGHELPGFHQPHGPGTRARWSRHALEAWARPNPC